MDKQQIIELLNQKQKLYDVWYQREQQSTWNDDGKGRHIPADKMIMKYKAQIEVLQEIINNWK